MGIRMDVCRKGKDIVSVVLCGGNPAFGNVALTGWAHLYRVGQWGYYSAACSEFSFCSARPAGPPYSLQVEGFVWMSED